MVAFNKQIVRKIASTKSYDLIFDKTYPKSKIYQVKDAQSGEIIKYFSKKSEARKFFIELVSKSPERDILKFMGYEYQL